jgi:hypothetical protein
MDDYLRTLLPQKIAEDIVAKIAFPDWNYAGKVLAQSRREIVQDGDRVTPTAQIVDEVRSDEPGASGNEDSHGLAEE